MQCVERVARILNGLSTQPTGVGLSSLARTVELPVPTTFRLLLALVEHGLVDYDRETKRYRLGSGLVRLTHHTLSGNSMRVLARKQLAALRAQWQESFFYSEMVDGRVICLDVVHPDQTHRVGLNIQPGREIPLHSSASAKAILAYQPRAVVHDLLRRRRLAAFTPLTITSIPTYIRSLAGVRSTGYAVCDQETQLGVVAVGVPVWDPSDEVIASLTVLGTSESIKGKLDALVGDLLDAAAQVRLQLRPEPLTERHSVKGGSSSTVSSAPNS